MRYRGFDCGCIFVLVGNRVSDEQEVSELGARSDVAAAAVAAGLARRESRLVKIREARAELEAAARQKAAEHAAKMEAEGRDHRTDLDTVVPKDKDHRNFIDPESKIMKTSNKGFDQCGNAQIVTTEDQIIVAAEVTNQANDVRQVEPMVEQLQANVSAAQLDGTVNEFIANAGYFSEANTRAVAQAGRDPFIATQRAEAQRTDSRMCEGPPTGQRCEGF
jgi:hypothetical protein